MKLGVLVSLVLAVGCEMTGGGSRPGRGRKPKSAFEGRKKAKVTERVVIRVSDLMAKAMEIPLPFEYEPEIHGAPARPESVVCKVVRVEDGGSTIIVQVPGDRKLVSGEELSIYMTIAPLPPSRYIKDHKKELYIGRAVVVEGLEGVEGGGGEWTAEVDDLYVEGPVKPGDLAIARGY